MSSTTWVIRFVW